MLNVSASRRSLLKLGAVSGALLALPFWSGQAISQPVSGASSKTVESKQDGLVSFNAGWVVPLGDKADLLALEQKKIKEAQAAAPQQISPNASGSDGALKPANKNWMDKAQDAWSKFKGFF